MNEDDVILDSSPENEDEQNTAISSDAEAIDEKQPTVTDLEEITRKALEQEDSSSSVEENQEQQEDSADEAEDEELPEEVSQEELEAQKPKTRRRIEQLLERNKEKDAQIEHLEPQAQEYQKIETFLEQNNVSFEEAGKSLEVSALINTGRHEEALERLIPIVRQLAINTGRIIPPDLQQKVQQGLISEELAREQARLRAGQTQKQDQQTTRQTQIQQIEQQFEQRMLGEIAETVKGKHENLLKTDPDYKLIQNQVLDRANRLSKGVKPKTVAEGVEFFDRAVKEVKEEMAKYKPRSMVNPPPQSSSGITSKQKPKTALEVTQAALGY